jgi:hypothetical protein
MGDEPSTADVHPCSTATCMAAAVMAAPMPRRRTAGLVHTK